MLAVVEQSPRERLYGNTTITVFEKSVFEIKYRNLYLRNQLGRPQQNWKKELFDILVDKLTRKLEVEFKENAIEEKYYFSISILIY